MVDEWLDIPSCPGYKCNRSGQILGKSGKILKLHLNNRGYYDFTFCPNTRQNQKPVLVHRVIAEVFLKEDNNNLTINHIDGNKLNNLPSNLEYISNSQNVQHAWKNGLMTNIGSSHPRSNLTENDIIEIRTLYSTEKYSQYTLAKKFKVSRSAIHKILTRKTWKHVS